MPIARCCTEQELSGEHPEQALLLHPCLALLLFPLPGSCSPKDAPNRYPLSPASVSLSLLNSPLPRAARPARLSASALGYPPPTCRAWGGRCRDPVLPLPQYNTSSAQLDTRLSLGGGIRAP